MLGLKGGSVVSHACLGKPVFFYIGNQFDVQESGLRSIPKDNIMDPSQLPGLFMSISGNTISLDFRSGYNTYNSMGVRLDIVYI